MRLSILRKAVSKKVLGIAVLALLTIVSVSSDAMAQGRGRRGSGLDKKCEKFVNCHDARDGRWDGRGPNNRVSYTSRIYRRNRWSRDSDRRWRRRHRDRDFGHNRNWRHRR
jgi:hypothetical protein